MIEIESLWTKETKAPRFKALEGDVKTDVLIIGGGISGILCAYSFTQAGVDCVLLEAERICGKTTKNTTAKITALHGAIYNGIIKRYGLDTARLYYEANQRAIEKYKHMCKSIDCDFEERAAYVYSLSDKRKIEDEAEALLRIGCKAEVSYNTELPFDVAGAVRIDGQAQFDPLKFLYAVAGGLHVYENTRVIEVRDNIAVTDKGRVSAKRIIVATHFPFINKHGAYFLKLYQHRSYVLALKNTKRINGMYVDENEKGFSFRQSGDLLLLGGGSHRTGKSGGSYNELYAFAKEYYPNAKEVCRWATQDCMSLDNIPYIGLYSKATPSLYVASGFNKWGMTSAMLASDILCDMILGKKSEAEEVFSPQRSILHPKLLINSAESALGLITPTVPRCPHLGCALKYNKAEHSWDCPCHGSRFSEDGRLIDNPATEDKKAMHLKKK